MHTEAVSGRSTPRTLSSAYLQLNYTILQAMLNVFVLCGIALIRDKQLSTYRGTL